MAIQDETGPVLVTVYCDRCGGEITSDYLVPAGTDSLDVARTYLARHGWAITPGRDLCPECRPRIPTAPRSTTTTRKNP